MVGYSIFIVLPQLIYLYYNSAFQFTQHSCSYFSISFRIIDSNSSIFSIETVLSICERGVAVLVRMRAFSGRFSEAGVESLALHSNKSLGVHRNITQSFSRCANSTWLNRLLTAREANPRGKPALTR